MDLHEEKKKDLVGLQLANLTVVFNKVLGIWSANRENSNQIVATIQSDI